MSLQTLLATSAAGLSALYFIKGAWQDFARRPSPSQGEPCGTCSSGGCPAARKG